MDPAYGGPCQGIRNSIPALEKIGVHNEVATLDDPAACFLRNDSFVVHALGPSKTAWAFSDRMIPWLCENLPRFDAVIIHGVWLFHGYAVRKALQIMAADSMRSIHREAKVPCCYLMPHGMLDPYFQSDPSRRLKAIRNLLYWKFIESETINGVDGLLFTCEQELILARKPFKPYAPKQELNIGYGVADPPGFSPGTRDAFNNLCPELGDRPYFLFLSRIHPKKGVDLLLEAYVKYISKITDANASPSSPDLVIAGPGLDTKYGRELQALAARHMASSSGDAKESNSTKRREKIHFPGMLSGEAKWGAFHGCEAFFLPSHQENFGISVVEALACSKPVYISDKVNIHREIAQCEAGFVAPDTMEGAIALFASWSGLAEQEREEMSKRARGCFLSHFQTDAAAQRLASIITLQSS